MRLDPHDADLRRTYRAAGDRRIAGPETREEPLARHTPAPPPMPAEVDVSPSPSFPAPPEGFDEDPVGASRIDDLTRRLQNDPEDDAVAGELVRLLEAFGRGHELVALLGARLDEAAPEQRPARVEDARRSLGRLLARAIEAGRDDLSALCRDALAAFAPDEPTPPR
jgi:hypothetical protein